MQVQAQMLALLDIGLADDRAWKVWFVALKIVQLLVTRCEAKKLICSHVVVRRCVFCCFNLVIIIIIIIN